MFSDRGALHSLPIGDPEFVSGGVRIVELFRQLAQTRRPPIPYEHMLEPIAILEAARVAQREGRRVALGEVLGGSAAGTRGSGTEQQA